MGNLLCIPCRTDHPDDRNARKKSPSKAAGFIPRRKVKSASVSSENEVKRVNRQVLTNEIDRSGQEEKHDLKSDTDVDRPDIDNVCSESTADMDGTVANSENLEDLMKLDEMQRISRESDIKGDIGFTHDDAKTTQTPDRKLDMCQKELNGEKEYTADRIEQFEKEFERPHSCLANTVDVCDGKREDTTILKEEAENEFDETDADDLEADGVTGKILLASDQALRSYGVCLFEDEIPEDPVEASLLASGLDNVNPDTRDAIDIMVMFGTFPMVKAIDRIKADESSPSRRTDPIPEEERNGSIRDLGWSRHMKNLEREEAEGRTGRRRGSSQQTAYTSQGNRRFSKCTDVMYGHDDEEEDALDQFLSKRRNRRSHDTVSKETGPDEGSRMIQRQTSHWKLPPVN